MIIDGLVVYGTLSNAYFLRFGNFCAYDNDDKDDNDNDDTTDYFTPCACTWDNKLVQMAYYYAEWSTILQFSWLVLLGCVLTKMKPTTEESKMGKYPAQNNKLT